ncbi:MAG: glycine betaine ABC transporter substrate-binding protein [Myxococcaceae bacterium]
MSQGASVVLSLLLAAPVQVGSKVFTESVVLGEVATRTLTAAGLPAVHRRELGGTRILWEALQRGELDVYPEYSGTLAEEIFSGQVPATLEALRPALASRGVRIAAVLGFQDRYALGMKTALAEQLGIRRISELAGHPQLRFAFSNEFLDRADGWRALQRAYALPQADVRGMDHDLAYRGLATGAFEVTDLYSTDAEVQLFGLRVLEDDRHHFPDYQALLLLREAAATPEVVAALGALDGRISVPQMVAMNVRAKVQRVPEAQVAADFLKAGGIDTGAPQLPGRARRFLGYLQAHLVLVVVSLAGSVLVGLPLGILAARRPRLGQAVLAAVGVLQTLPSLALLVLMIPLLGIGARPAIAALFLYGLLPVVRNTHAGLTSISGELQEAAEALGVSGWERLRRIDLPLASPAILAGIQTSAVICVGTATLGALVGAGGFGQPILTGIRLDNTGLLLEGAIPAALLALAVQGCFEWLGRFLVPRGLRPGRTT